MEEEKISLLMKNWSIDVDVLNRDSQKAQWNKPSIYKLPAPTTGGSSFHNNKNSAAYLPYTVSFGPYHHHKGDHLKKMDPHKHRVLGHFLRRYNINLQKLVDSLTTPSCRWQQVDHAEEASADPKTLPVLQHLMDSYDSLDDELLHDQDGFLKLMILDGCFMLEILQWSSVSDYHKALSSGSVTAATSLAGSINDYFYADNDPIFSRHGKLYVMSYIRRDMLMLENQLPMLLLKTLLGAVLPTQQKEDIEEHLNMITSNFCRGSSSYKNRNMGSCLHVLDLYRKSLLSNIFPDDPQAVSALNNKNSDCWGSSKAKGPITMFSGQPASADQKNSTAGNDGTDEDIIRSAMNLHDSGIKFEKSTTDNLTDIWFEGHILKLPVMVIDDITESTLLNLMAFERFHVGAGNEITSYVCFMDNIIDSLDDVKILRSAGVLHNAIGSDKAMAKLFNEMTKDVTPDPESRLEKIVQKQLDEYCRSRWHEWRANLCHTYFKSPWALLSLLAAVFLLALTICQTFYTIYPYYKPRGT
ncbi:hypothetical protein MKW98_013929 [Papaver atlanticum]|uniref:Uncharacterized protein n=1 Tax=Papaver atlanticum TaxID=357466 RepID=A0AAD4XCZ7_9MAGN|nr:hypothetical protein MKW98_013929 [Papaver atlanticum]